MPPLPKPFNQQLHNPKTIPWNPRLSSQSLSSRRNSTLFFSVVGPVITRQSSLWPIPAQPGVHPLISRPHHFPHSAAAEAPSEIPAYFQY